MIDVNFELHKVTINTDDIVSAITTHFSNDEFYEELKRNGVEEDNPTHSFKFQLNEKAFLIGNHCFGEAIHSNPLKDLEIWAEWVDGVRKFPFSGHYLNLGITKQKNKKISEGLLGTLGEIIGGLLFNTQAVTLVRPIQKFPDFIGKLKDGNGWAFLEAKCTQDREKKSLFNKRVPGSEYKKVCSRAIKEITNEK